jgi:hypothetical protein
MIIGYWEVTEFEGVTRRDEGHKRGEETEAATGYTSYIHH